MRLRVFRGREVGEGELEFPVDSDKSISHRTAIFSLLTGGINRIKNYLDGEDTLHSLKIAEQLGAQIVKRRGERGLEVEITPLSQIQEPTDILYCGNSGTTIRIYSGLLAGTPGFFVLSGDKYLNRRPMGRVLDPLREIGGKVDGRSNGNYPPLAIRGGRLKGFRYSSPIPSAQVKSALILAGLQGDSCSYYREPELSRDHTERMLKRMGAPISKEGEWIKIEPLEGRLEPLELEVPGDPSSGFFFAVWGAIAGKRVLIPNVTLNPTRIGAYKILEKMGVPVEYHLREEKYEPIGDILINGTGKLKGVEVSENIPALIDELPALAIGMAFGEGESLVRNAKELRVKESDRIKGIVKNLQRMGVEAEELADGFRIVGGTPKGGIQIDSYGDHRLAMSFAIAGAVVGDLEITEGESIYTSFPRFFELFKQIALFEVVEE
ncbi:MAG: 3-phosphoshikimate 1-carboxyvinyltransferase [Campylobacterales bacterium]